MKALLPHPFFIYASKFTLKSMLLQIGKWSQYLANNSNKQLGHFARKEKYHFFEGKREIKGETYILQTWLINIIYEIIKYNSYGTQGMNKQQALYLFNLFSDYADKVDEAILREDVDPILYAMGFFGEQSRIQGAAMFFEEFSREKYILEEISYKTPPENTYGIDTKKEFFEETNFSTDEFSALLLFMWSYFSKTVTSVKLENVIVKSQSPLLSKENLAKVISMYSITPDEIRQSPLKRQVLYTKPLIEIDGEYFTTNPFLLLSLFSSSIYWTLRNKYQKKNSQNFINAFGHYFETYVQEVLDNCIDKSCFYKIPEDDDKKRADWYIKLDDYEFIVEQKSALSLLGIKQSHPDMNAMKKHILTNWGEAVRQLDETKTDLKLSNPIKIILVYEDYYKSACLDQLFEMDTEITNDRKYWLLSICEFEDLLYIYKTNQELALQIVKEKDETEITHANRARDLKRLFFKHDIENNLYLRATGIYDNHFEFIKSLCIQNL